MLYILINFAYLSAVSIDRLSGVDNVASVVGAAIWGETGGLLVSILIAVGLISTVSAMIIVGPRVYEAMARDGLFPPALAKLNQHGVPSWAVGLQAGIAIIIALTATFEAVLVYIGYTLNIFAALAVYSVFLLRKQNRLPVRSCLGYPVTPVIFLVFAIWMTVWSIQSKPISTLTGLGTLAAGYAVYLIQSRRKKAGADE